ncbi:MAG: DNA mismatch repair protein MutS [Clostridia bacterium]|nr:DNA mismatch repair protein MutS [Clostridia bacterium]
MMEQYFEIKNQYKDYILFYRLGDFYEMFYDDAVIASREIDLTLTGKDCGEPERAPMCGVPFHSAETYIGKLLEKGYKVAICEQTEDPALAKGLVRREVIRVVTPGTLIEPGLLKDQKNNYLCSINMTDTGCGVCFADVSTSQIFATSFDGPDAVGKLTNELGTYEPSEILINTDASFLEKETKHTAGGIHAVWNTDQKSRYDEAECRERVISQFKDMAGSPVLEDKPLVGAVGALLSYISEMEKGDISYISELRVYRDDQFMEIELNTRRNLELTETLRTKDKRGTLLWVLDHTKSAPGARLLRKWIEHPLRHVKSILRRQGAVEELFQNFMLREEIGDLLSQVLDLERLVTKVVYGSANAKDMRAIVSTISILPGMKATLEKCKSEELCRIRTEMDTLDDIRDLIQKAIADNPPFSLREGGLIADGYNEQVDYLRSVMHDGKSWVEKLADEEREKTGIKTLKIGYNKVFGYYIEITRSLLDQVPERYIRKQTLTGAERFITQELKDLESTILGAEGKICALEYEIFQQIRVTVAEDAKKIQKAAALLSELDAYLSLATAAVRNKYSKPEVDEADVINIKEGRHPVVERFVKDSYFVPNDTYLDTNRNRMMLITGPNMAGKSTYMRQVALITLMAQIGSFVPAADARIGVVDKIFTRVGASDDLASGQSTFMLEMNEVAYILKHATKRSLIIYDEVGRGTSTFDGMSIARAILEYTNGKKIGAKTLFATHYHELTSMENEFDGIVNYNIAAKKRGDEVTFLRKIIRGSSDDSYGIEVAKLAGLPNEVIKRAKEILRAVELSAKDLTTSDSDLSGLEDDSVIDLDDVVKEQVIQQLKALDINSLSPYEAISLLFQIQKQIKEAD